jgi:hypothetical protein
MKTRVLVRVGQDRQEWVASAYYKESAFSTVRAESRDAAVAELRAQVEEILLPQARAWLQEWRGTDDAPNCPEAAIRLPIDLWVCKLTDETCPIQAQVFVQEPEKFFGGCLAPSERKQKIFDTVAQGKYEGFHHVPGRLLCISCDREGKKLSFRYHYPWELTCVEAYCPSFSLEREWPTLLRRLGSEKISLSMLSNALCAEHCKQLAEQLDSQVAAELSTFELEVSR